MNDSHIVSIAQIKAFLKLDREIGFKALSKEEMYGWIDEALTKFRYFSLRKKDQGIVRKYAVKLAGLSSSQLTRLVKKKKWSGKVFLSSTKRNSFPVRYTSRDIGLLVTTDNVHNRLSGPATRKILEREFKEFGKKD